MTSLSVFDLSTHGPNVEHLRYVDMGSAILTGNGLNNEIIGNAGDDKLTGNAGNDTLEGGIGKDTMVGGIGNDVYVVFNASTMHHRDRETGHRRNTQHRRHDHWRPTSRISRC